MYHSLHLLFEKRLGGTLVRPIGYEWHDSGYWCYSHNPGIVKQFLEIPNDAKQVEGEGEGVLQFPCQEGTKTYIHTAMTLNASKHFKFDYIIGSISSHELTFYTLQQQLQPQAKLIRHMGNINESYNILTKNVLNSTSMKLPPEINSVTYRQEFDLEDFSYRPPTNHNLIKNFQNCFPTAVDFPLYHQYKKAMPDFTFKMHGALGEELIIPQVEMPESMKDAGWIWHVKWGGDGYGFLIHQAYAVGRPTITKREYYAGKLADPLLVDGETCIDISNGTVEENAARIRYFSDPARHLEMARRSYERFKEVINFDEEFIQIQRFLERCS